MSHRIASRGAVLLLAASLAGCDGPDQPEGGRAVAYVALDQEFSRPILDDFQRETGIVVDAKYDVESTKTVGLTNRILAEADRPLCDLFWNNEILNTLRLKRAGLLASFAPEQADAIPDEFKAPDGTWYGFAARARVLIVNTDLVPEGERPTSILDLADPKWRGKAAIAKPLFGTTASHAACLFAAWGDERAKQFFRDLKANDVQVLLGNKQVAIEVASGRLAIGLTDTDDVMVMIEEQGAPVVMVYPDQGDDEVGTLFIPNTLAIIQGGPDTASAEALASYLLTPEVEAALAAGPGAQIPLLTTSDATSRVETTRTKRAMVVDFEAAADRWDDAAEFIRAEFAE